MAVSRPPSLSSAQFSFMYWESHPTQYRLMSTFSSSIKFICRDGVSRAILCKPISFCDFQKLERLFRHSRYMCDSPALLQGLLSPFLSCVQHCSPVWLTGWSWPSFGYDFRWPLSWLSYHVMWHSRIGKRRRQLRLRDSAMPPSWILHTTSRLPHLTDLRRLPSFLSTNYL